MKDTTERPRHHAAPRVRVWDPLLRLAHWALVLGVLGSWLTRHGFGAVHEWLGYAVLATVVLRLAWGFGGPGRARFGAFLPGPRRTLAYARTALRGAQPRYLGHNPLGGWMSVLLLAWVAAVCLTGWLYTTDRYWGVEWVGAWHDGLTTGLIVLVALHLLGVAWSSIHGRENLVGAMIHGRKRQAGSGDVD